MCGIAGIVVTTDLAESAGLLARMSQRIGHRGPDDVGYLQWAPGRDVVSGREPQPASACTVGLAHRRLAVLDLSEAARQPMSTGDGRFHLVFNGEIYNFVELRQQLEDAGAGFRSRGDTEVLLAAFARWGPDSLRRLVGMFALAVLDVQKRTLFLARDFFGIKPLYYTRWRHGFAFASEIKALLELPGVGRRANPARLYDYIRFGLTDHGDQTMIDGIRQLPPAGFLEIPLDAPGDPQVDCYWNPDQVGRADLSLDEAAARLRELWFDNVRLHMRSDVPVGAALSGGIDSSAIVVAMRHLMGRKLELHTFHYAAGAGDIDEESYAELAARTAGATAHAVRAGAGDLIDSLDELIDSQDEPFGSTSIFAQRCVFAAAARRGIKVMLDGQGADEILGGYRYFTASRAATLLRRGSWLEAWRLLARARELPPSGQAPPLPLHAAGLLLPKSLHAAAMKAIGQDLMPEWLDAEWFARHDVALRPPRQADGPEYLREQLWLATRQTSLPELLRYEDRNSMAFSIESRVPFLTPELVEFVLSLPEQYIVGPDGTSKRVFRAAMRGLVPDEILDRKDKIGFATPERAWLAELRHWVTDVLACDAAAEIPAINLAAMRRRWKSYLESNRAGESDFRFWRWVNLIRWVEMRMITFD